LRKEKKELHLSKQRKNFELSNYYPLAITIVFIIFLFQYTFSFMEAVFYDLRVKLDTTSQSEVKIVLITQDEESDEFLAEQYPYTYSTHNIVLEEIAKDKPLLINYFTRFKYPSVKNEEEISNYETFVSTIKENESLKDIIRFSSTIQAGRISYPPQELKDIGHSFGDIVVDENIFAKDDVLRRLVLSFRGEESIHLWSANKIKKIFKKDEKKASDYKGAYYSRESDAIFAMFRYHQSPLEYSDYIEQIPFHTVRVGNIDKGYFKDKIVIIGPSYISNPNDYLLTPFDRENFLAPKMMGHAAIIQSLIHDKTIYPISRNFSFFIGLVIVIFLSLLMSNLRPTKGLITIIVCMILVLLIAYLLFVIVGLWLYVAPIVVAIFVVYYIWVPFRAISEYQKSYAIQEETKLLKKVENLKQNFISLMSHDLKTPVAKIAGLADNILQERATLTDTQRKNTSLIIDSTKELNSFITSILDLTKVESSNIKLNMQSKDVNKIIEEAVRDLTFEAEEKNISMAMNLAPLYPIHIDQILIKRVISNLVENAVKYSGEGSHVIIKSWDDDETVTMTISDNGAGIPASDVDNIFEKFYRIKNDASHSIKGTGLGLYLVKYFVELHEGTISVASEQEVGTTFTVVLKNK